MQRFEDAKGDEWRLAITFADVQRVEREVGLDLLSLFDEDMKLLAKLSSNFGQLVSVVACLCNDQIDSKGLTAEQFAGRFAGDVLANAFEALLQAVVDFFPSESRRAALREWLKRMNRVSETILETATPEVMRQMDAAIEQMSAGDWAKLAGGRSSNSPG